MRAEARHPFCEERGCALPLREPKTAMPRFGQGETGNPLAAGNQFAPRTAKDDPVVRGSGARRMKITVVGCGYVGLVSGVGLAASGHEVTGVDISEERVGVIRQGKS